MTTHVLWNERDLGTLIAAELLVNFHLEWLPEGGRLAMCANRPGFVVKSVP